jgi:hypothetical protein
VIDPLKPWRGRHPPQAPLAAGAYTNLAGWLTVLPCPPVGLALMLAGGALIWWGSVFPWLVVSPEARR